MKKRTDIVECPACGVRVRPAARKVPHPETAECKALQVRQAYRKRGWTCIDETYAKIVADTGVPIERALGGHRLVDKAETDDEDRVIRKWTEDLLYEVAFIPRQVYELLSLMKRLQMTAAERRFYVRQLWRNPDAITALDTLRRLGRLRTTDIERTARAQKGLPPDESEDDRDSDDDASPFASLVAHRR